LVITKELLESVVCFAADGYFQSNVAEGGYIDGFEVLEDLEPAIVRLQLGEVVGITAAADYKYLHDRPITEPWEETTRTSTVHVEVQLDEQLNAKVVLEWGSTWLPEPQFKW
jgi:hypothetical protein